MGNTLDILSTHSQNYFTLGKTRFRSGAVVLNPPDDDTLITLYACLTGLG